MDIVIDEEGRAWVEREAVDGRMTWEVYDAQGRLIGELTRPSRAGRVQPRGRSSTVRVVPRNDRGYQTR